MEREKTKKNSIKKNYVFNLIYQITIILLPLIVTPYIARVLTAEGVGIYSFCFATITYFTILASLGFENYAQREISVYQNDKHQQSKVFFEVFLCRLIPMAVALVINTVLILANTYGEYTNLMWILNLNIIAIGLDVVFFFQGNEEFVKIVLRNLIIKIIGTICLFVFIKSQADILLYTLINSLMIIVSSLSLIPAMKGRLCKVSFKELQPVKHLKFALKLFIPAVAITLYTVLDKFLIGVITGSNLENGYYEQAEKIIKVGMTVVTCLGIVMIPRNSSAIAQGKVDEVKENVYKAFNFVWLLGFPIAFGLLSIASNLVPWFLGDGYDKVVYLMYVLSTLFLIICASNFIGIQYLLTWKRDGQFTKCIIIGALTNILFSIVLIYFFESLGACISTVLAELMVTISMIVLLRKELSFKKIFKTMWKPFLSAVIMGAVVFALSLYLVPSILNTFILVFVAIVVYGVCILLFRESLTLDFFKLIFKRKNCK